MKAKEIGLIKGVKIGKENIEISHLQFADDTLIFSPANLEVIFNVCTVLDCFALIFGLNINYSKLALIPLG